MKRNSSSNKQIGKCVASDQSGATLVELLAGIVILSLVISGMASFFINNQRGIRFNRTYTQAQAVKADVKEWMMNLGVSGDLADLNWVCFISKTAADPEELARSKYVLLDDTGVVLLPGRTYSKFGEKMFSNVTDKGGVRTPLRKITYDGVVIPPELSGTTERLGYYRDDHNFLVGMEVMSIDSHVTYGLNVKLNVYHSQSGQLLSETYFKWVIMSDNFENPVINEF